MKLSSLSLASLIPLAAAHFKIEYPNSRARVEEKMPIFPCGGSAPTKTRTQVPLSNGSFPVALSMGHSGTAVEMLLALGTHPGEHFNITLVPTFGLEGLGSFCLPHVSFSPDLLGANVTDGTNATLQVQTSGDPNGGLYACADIQFSSSISYHEPSSCKNNSAMHVTLFSGAAAHRDANESTPDGRPQSGSNTMESASGTSNTATSTSMAGAGALETAAWGVLGAAVAGGLAVL